MNTPLKIEQVAQEIVDKYPKVKDLLDEVTIQDVITHKFVAALIVKKVISKIYTNKFKDNIIYYNNQPEGVKSPSYKLDELVGLILTGKHMYTKNKNTILIDKLIMDDYEVIFEQFKDLESLL